jgi:hypothetical protein
VLLQQQVVFRWLRTKVRLLSAQEEGRLRDIGVQLDLEEVAGAQLAAANAQELGAQAMAQGMEGVTSLGSQLAANAPLFEKSASARQTQKLSNSLAKEFKLDQPGIQQSIARQGMVDGFDFSKVGGLSQQDFEELMIGVPASTLKKLREKTVGNLTTQRDQIIKGFETGRITLPGFSAG